ncbi:BREX-1 system adenine-specific DNA-methyltransferase PglX [Endozoicomonas acroporae]|uniref:BREX-1 system adenine-specific DNA-methyltransferase PglX n=1 Tax=Endozoicomonas acroporae TaxID=1701104 RepID=UPI000C75EBFB|nr:BREX-1 system adenine-specific DNA-methyltransferase PglX [Endozoicomonas acroporae]
MKLADHVDSLRELIEGAFDKQFARLGFGSTKQTDVEKLSEKVKQKRARFNSMLASHEGETGSYQSGREKLIDELTFTLFNRLAAIKVMEAASLFRPILTKQMEHGNRSFGHKAWLEDYPHMRDEELEGIRDYIKHAFDELGQTLPLYSKEYPYALLPDPISLNEIIERFNAIEQDAQVGSDIWLSDDVLGWMYESYNNQKKKAHKDSKAKTEYDKVSLQSQVYTPRWVVEFLVQNSLGKLYLEMYPDSEIKKAYKIANVPETRVRERKPLHEVKIIDPACGSGNFLLYAFDFYYALYQDQIDNYGADYEEKDIPKLIIENNLHGIDLDDRAVQLAQLGLYIKARKKRRTIGELSFNVVSSDFYLPNYNEVRTIFENGSSLMPKQKQLIEKVWGDLRYAYKFGSLIHINDQMNQQLKQLEEKVGGDLFGAVDVAEHKNFASTFFTNLAKAVEQFAKSGANTFLTSKARDAITFLELLTTEYDVAAANPPYTDTSEFGPDLKKFIEANFKKPNKFHTNLYASFIKRCFDLTAINGKIALIHPDTFMFIKTFEGVREFIIQNTHIDIFVHYPQTGGVFGIGIIYPSFYVLEKNKVSQTSNFINLSSPSGGRDKEINNFKDRLSNCIKGVNDSFNYKIEQEKFKAIKSWPFIYWISDSFRSKFEGTTVNSKIHVTEGFKSNDNQKILRYFWEIMFPYTEDHLCYYLYTKGGDYNKWYGNNWFVLKWEDSGNNQIKNGANLTAKDYYFQEGVTYSKSSNRGNSFRYLEKDVIFDSAAPSMFDKSFSNLNVLLATMNSKLVQSILKSLNPSVSSQVGDIKRVPLVDFPKESERNIDRFVQEIISIKKTINSFSLIEPNYSESIFVKDFSRSFANSAKNLLNIENHLACKILIIEKLIDEIVFKEYKITDEDKDLIILKEGENIASYPVLEEAREEYLAFEKSHPELSVADIRGFISEISTLEFSTEQQQIIEKEFSNLYQKNNDFEGFCNRHKINPINIWYWFKNSKIIPKQRMNSLAMEFLVDIIREILMDDEDGIVPLVSNAGEKVLIDRIEEVFQKKGFTSAQYSSFDSVLGHTINDYTNKYFFEELTEYLNLFQYLPKTPFIWHLTSGPEQGFDCYIIIYKWSRDKLMRLRSVYIENRERALANRQSDLADSESAEAQNEKAHIFKQLKEIDAFKKKIDELLAEGYNPILDDGVGKNIAPLQKKKMLAYDVLNAGQLKKYLNADW